MVPSYYSAQVSPQKGSSNFARRDTWQILRVSITSTHYTVHTRSIHYTVHSMQYTVHARSIQYTVHITSLHGCVLIDPSSRPGVASPDDKLPLRCGAGVFVMLMTATGLTLLLVSHQVPSCYKL